MGRSSQRSESDTAPPLAGAAILRDEVPFITHCLRMFRVRPEDLDDVLQEVLVALHRHLPEYDASRPVRPWISAFVARQALHHHRDRSRLREQLVPPPERLDSAPDPEETMSHDQLRQEVREILDTLDFDRCAVLLAVDVLEMTAGETAEALGVPENTVKSRLRLAREDFKRAWTRRQLAKGRRGAAVLPLSASALLAPLREVSSPAPRARPASALWKGASHLISGAVGAAMGAAVVLTLLSPRTPGIERTASEAAAAPAALAVREHALAPIPAPGAPPAVPSVAPEAASASSAKPARGRPSGLTTERNLLSAAQAALDRGNTALARSTLATCARRFPHGELAATRRALWETLLELETRAGRAPIP